MSVFHTTTVFAALDDRTESIIRNEFERHKQITKDAGEDPNKFDRTYAAYKDHVDTWDELVKGKQSRILYREFPLHNIDLEDLGVMLPATIDDLIINGVYTNYITSKRLYQQFSTIWTLFNNKPMSWGAVSYSDDGDATVVIHDFHNFKNTKAFDMFMSETLKLESNLISGDCNTAWDIGIKDRLQDMLSNLDAFVANSTRPLNHDKVIYHGFMNGSTTINLGDL